MEPAAIKRSINVSQSDYNLTFVIIIFITYRHLDVDEDEHQAADQSDDGEEGVRYSISGGKASQDRQDDEGRA